MAIFEAGLTEVLVITQMNFLWSKLNPEHQLMKQIIIPGTSYKLTGVTLNAFFDLCPAGNPISSMVLLLEAVRTNHLEAKTLTNLIDGQHKLRQKIKEGAVPQKEKNKYRRQVPHILTQIHRSQT